MAPPEDPGPADEAAARISSFQWLVLTSANAVELFLPRCHAPDLLNLQLASIGPATTRALSARGLAPTVEASRSLAEGLLEALETRINPGDRILLPQARDARPVLAQGLSTRGAWVTQVEAYRKKIPDDAPALARSLFQDSPAGWITFTSPSIARNLKTVLGADWERFWPAILAASVGPITSDALRDLGLEPAVEAQEPGDEGLVEAIVGAVLQASGQF
jgi:uroporphyrinogen-III synthase